jgi:hypothetical protein
MTDNALTPAQVRNILWYVAIAIAGAIMAAGLQLGVMLSGPGDILYRPLAATFVTTLFGTLATAAGASFRPRVDRSDISHLVSRIGPEQAKAALEDEAVRQAVGGDSEQPLSAAQVDQIASRLLELRAEHEADAEGHPVVVVPRRGGEPPTIADDGGEV